jgi:sterol desaturase/sphingolipid hydroxylase (fatty acid hydroxylase superfamily)
LNVGSVAVALALLALLFWPLERLRPSQPQPAWRSDTPTDVAYWFFTPLVTRAITRASLIIAVVVLAFAAGVPIDRDHVRAFAAGSGRGLGRQPVWLQVVEVLLLGDVIGYWSHRLFHGRRLWPFHAVHHSSTQVDWLSSVRLHPVNDAVSRVLQAVPLVLLGFAPGIMAAYVPFLTFHAIFLHANVPWSFGPLRSVVSSPVFHRWHHTMQAEGLDKNFAGLFPLIDRAFGTYYMPLDRPPAAFGIDGNPVPSGLVAQLLYPFRRAAVPER